MTQRTDPEHPSMSPSFEPDPLLADMALQRSPKPRRRWPWVAGIVVALLSGVGIGSASPGEPATSTTPQSAPITKTVTVPAERITQTETVAPMTVTQTVAVTIQAESPSPRAAAGPLTEFGAGTYEVAIDIKAGKYKTPGPNESDPLPFCYWARNKDSSGSLNSIIANGNIEGPGTVAINKGEVFQVSGSCIWKLAQ